MVLRKNLLVFVLFLTVLADVRAFAQIAKEHMDKKAENLLVRGLSFMHLYAPVEAVTPARDRQIKTMLIGLIRAKKPGLSWDLAREVFDKQRFEQLAGKDGLITFQEMERMIEEKIPASRTTLFSRVREQVDLLSTQFDLIEERHRLAAEALGLWISQNYRPGKSLGVIVVCTGNSRRSILGSTMGNIAASYYGMPEVRFFSGGTTPSAFNTRTIASLKEIGVEVDPTGEEAPWGAAGDPNPIYTVRWGTGLETTEFSKLFSDAQNPQTGFAAIMVCSEADEACPIVKGASKRISSPYPDPKDYDGAKFDAAKYAERRDDIGRMMLSALLQARRRLDVVH